jgi:hypothetical protein
MCQSPDKDTTIDMVRNQAGWSRREFSFRVFSGPSRSGLTLQARLHGNSNVEETTPKITPRSQHRPKVRVMATLQWPVAEVWLEKTIAARSATPDAKPWLLPLQLRIALAIPGRAPIRTFDHFTAASIGCALFTGCSGSSPGLEHQSGDWPWPDRRERAGRRWLMPERSLRSG